jgi:CBS domain-containing protein
MRIANVYRPTVFGCRSDERLQAIAGRMVEKQVGALAVLDGEQVTGIITERDLVRALASGADPASTPAIDCASTQVYTAQVEEDSREVARRMLEAGIRHLPVEEEGRMVGMVSTRDLLAVESWTP